MPDLKILRLVRNLRVIVPVTGFFAYKNTVILIELFLKMTLKRQVQMLLVANNGHTPSN